MCILFDVDSSFVPLSKYYYGKSKPPPSMLHRFKRHIPFCNPLIKPYFSMARIIYSEQEGSNRHLFRSESGAYL